MRFVLTRTLLLRSSFCFLEPYHAGELIEKFGGKATAAEKGKGIAAVSEAASDLGSPGSSSAKTFLQSPGHTAYAHSYESMPANPSVHWQESHAADPENPWYAMSKHQSVLEDHQQELRFHRSAIGDGETAVRQNRKHIQELAQNNAELQAKVAQIKSNSPGRWSGKGRDLLAWTAFGTAGAVAVTSGLHNKQHAEQAEAESKQISELRAEVAKLKGSQGRPTPTYVNGPSVGQEGVAAFNAGAGGGLV